MRILTALLVALLWAGSAAAQTFPPSGGETSLVWACFYECKKGPDVQGEQTFQEVTSLMITNQGRLPENVQLYYLDGNENFVAWSDLSLSSLDLDEVSICHTILQSGAQPPSAGLVEILSFNQTRPSGVKAWMKNVVGKFFHSNPEIFEGRVQGIGKTRCEAVPVPDVNDPLTIQAAGDTSPMVPPILIEDTADAVLPDLIPVPDPASASFCRLASGPSGLELVVEVANVGVAASGATDTHVDFFTHGNQTMTTPGLAPSASTFLNFPIPVSCHDPDCDFRITVDSGGAETESDEGNNSEVDFCLG